MHSSFLEMRRRLKVSLIVGFVISLSFHLASAIITAVYPYSDSPTTPPLMFFFLLELGWVLSGQPLPLFRVWRGFFAVCLHVFVCRLVFFCLLSILGCPGDASCVL